MSERPPGLTDEEWAEHLRIQKMLKGRGSTQTKRIIDPDTGEELSLSGEVLEEEEEPREEIASETETEQRKQAAKLETRRQYFVSVKPEWPPRLRPELNRVNGNIEICVASNYLVNVQARVPGEKKRFVAGEYIKDLNTVPKEVWETTTQQIKNEPVRLESLREATRLTKLGRVSETIIRFPSGQLQPERTQEIKQCEPILHGDLNCVEEAKQASRGDTCKFVLDSYKCGLELTATQMAAVTKVPARTVQACINILYQEFAPAGKRIVGEEKYVYRKSLRTFLDKEA